MPDLGATILSLAGATADYQVDGRVIPFASASSQTARAWMEDRTNVHSRATPTQDKHHSVSEYWVYGVEEGKYGGAYTRAKSP